MKIKMNKFYYFSSNIEEELSFFQEKLHRKVRGVIKINYIGDCQYNYIPPKSVLILHEDGWLGGFHEGLLAPEFRGTYLFWIGPRRGGIARRLSNYSKVLAKSVIKSTENLATATRLIRRGMWAPRGGD